MHLQVSTLRQMQIWPKSISFIIGIAPAIQPLEQQQEEAENFGSPAETENPMRKGDEYAYIWHVWSCLHGMHYELISVNICRQYLGRSIGSGLPHETNRVPVHH